tara:strand:+ start:184 stop:1005 length:822 start_codon:yes stop_codon:yes gene_type:complete
MKKLLTERRLCELAGLLTEESDGDTVELWKTRRDQAKRDRHAAEKAFFGSDRDPLVTTDVPADLGTADVEPLDDPDATQELSPSDMKRLDSEIGDAKLRPVAMDIYQRLVAPEYGEDDLEVMAHNDSEIQNLVNQLFGWFHPAAMDSRGQPTYENPGRWAVMVAQQFEKEGKDLIDNAEEFNDRIEKLEISTGKKEFEPSRQSQARHMANEKALGDIIKTHKSDPRFAEELPPLAHAGAHGMSRKEYGGYLRRIFKDEYRDLYQKYLSAYLSS